MKALRLVLLVFLPLWLTSCSTYTPILSGETSINSQYGAIQGYPNYSKKKTFYGKNWVWLVSLGAAGAGYGLKPQLTSLTGNANGTPLTDQQKRITGTFTGLAVGFVSSVVFGYLRKEFHVERKKYTAAGWLRDFNRHRKTNYIVAASAPGDHHLILVPPQYYGQFISQYKAQQIKEAELATQRAETLRQQRAANATIIIGGIIWLLSNGGGEDSHERGNQRESYCSRCGGSGRLWQYEHGSSDRGFWDRCLDCNGTGRK